MQSFTERMTKARPAEALLPESLTERSSKSPLRRRRASTEAELITTLDEETPDETYEEPLLKLMNNSASAKYESGPVGMGSGQSWPSRRMVLGARAVAIGLGGGAISALYKLVLDWGLEMTWKRLGPITVDALGLQSCPWLYIPLACTVFGTCTGILLTVLGAPTANLPGVVLEVNRDGRLSNDVGQMVPISMMSIVAAGSLGPEAPLVSIGGGLASQYASWCELNEAETLIVTMCGMGAGLAAFFGDPVGGALFGCEVLHRSGLEYYEAVIPTVTAGLASNLAFRTLLGIEATPIVWTFPAEGAINNNLLLLDEEPKLSGFARFVSLVSVYAPGITYGVVGAAVAICWMRCLNHLKHIAEPWSQHHVLKGLVGGLLLGLIGMVAPPVLFWGEAEAQRLVDPEQELPHVWPQIGVSGHPIAHYGAAGLFGVAFLKLLSICITILAGYRGGFIFPLMNAGIGIGVGVSMVAPAGSVSLSAAALSFAAALNTAVTRSVLSTPLVLTSLTVRVDLFPTILAASIISLHLTSHVAVITCAAPRRELEAGISPPGKF